MAQPYLTFALLMASLMTFGCSGDTGNEPDFLPGGCGLTGYEWLPAEQVGELVSFSELENMRYAASTLDAMLTVAGAGMLTPSPYGVRAYKMRYTTQDKGEKLEATGLVLIPWIDGEAIAPRPEVIFAHGTNGFANECAPGREAEEGDLFALMLVASRGYVVAAPDFIGLDAQGPIDQANEHPHAYLGMEQMAIGSFDCLRATRRLVDGELSDFVGRDERVVLWGASQGGHAVFANLLYAQHYAPEMDIRAAVALIPPTNLKGLTAYAVSSPNPATAALSAVIATLQTWYEGPQSFDGFLVPELAEGFDDALFVGCDAGDRFDGITQVDQVYQSDFIASVAQEAWDALSPWACYLEQNSVLGSGLMPEPNVPIFFTVSENDTLVYSPTQRADFDRLCAAGYQLDYLEWAGADHAGGALFSLPEQFAWVEARLAGEPIPAEELCVRQDAVTCLADPGE